MILPGIGSAIGARQQTWPNLRGAVQASSQSSGATFAPVLPTHQTGDLLVLVVAYSVSGSPTIVSAAGWTSRFDTSTGNSRLTVLTKRATGSGTTVSLTNSNNGRATAHAFVLIDAADQAEGASVADNRDPPSLSPSWGQEQTLWMEAASTATGTAPASGSTGFSGGVQTLNGSASLTTYTKAETVASQDPDTFGSGGTVPADIYATIGIRPL